MKKILLVLLCFVLTGCVSHVNRIDGGVLAQYSEKQIRDNILIGQSTKKDVLKFLGRPNIPDDYNAGNNWTYLSKVVDRRIYLIVSDVRDKQVILSIRFNNNMIVDNILYQEN